MPLEQTLALVDQQLAQVSDHLLANDALALERSSAGLRHAISSFSEAMVLARRQQVLSPALVQRLQDIHARLGVKVHRMGAPGCVICGICQSTLLFDRQS